MSDEEPEGDKALEELLANIDKHPFGIITQRGYQELENVIQKWIFRGLVAFAIIGVFCGLSLVGFGILLTNQSNTTQEIQNQRYKATLDSCKETNARHNNVIKRTDEAVAATPEAERKRAEEGAKPFKLILEAAVPFTQDCEAFARDRVEGKG